MRKIEGRSALNCNFNNLVEHIFDYNVDLHFNNLKLNTRLFFETPTTAAVNIRNVKFELQKHLSVTTGQKKAVWGEKCYVNQCCMMIWTVRR